MKPLTEPQYSVLRTLGILTGSRAFGCATEDSDIDILIRPNALQRVKITADQKGLSHLSSDFIPNEEPLSFYCIGPSGDRVNVLIKNDKDFTLWLDATESVQYLIDTNPVVAKSIKNKNYRIKLFQLLRGEY